MVTSSYKRVQEFKSPYRVTAAFLLRSRESLRTRNAHYRDEIRLLHREAARPAEQSRQQQRQIERQARRIEELERQQAEAKNSVQLPEDPPLGTHGYGARMIALSVNLARSVGLRGAARVMEIIFDWLSLKVKTPSRSSIRNWLQRLGIAKMSEPLDDADDLIIMADHSCQIGQEKVLAMLGVKASELPEPGQALQHHHLNVLMVKPGNKWKTEDMEKEYEAIAEHYGTPRLVLSDGAPELQNGAKCLKNRRSDTIVLRDLKHFAANIMKSVIGKDERFQEVIRKIGQARTAVQQTELAHLTPPRNRPKARFMNLAAIIRWMDFVGWLLKNPNAEGRAGISDERLQEKLGWVADFANDTAAWQACQHVVSTSITFINKQYLYRGASADLQREIGDALQHKQSRIIAERMLAFVLESEQQLRPGERLPLSTEILESLFGLYKQLEGQQSKSGFTSLLACFPALLQATTPAEIQESFARVSKRDVEEWTQEYFASTVTSRRQAAYAEHKRATNTPTPT